MLNARYYLLLLGCTLFLSGCLDKVDLQVHRGYLETLIIQSKLIKDNPSRVRLNISRLYDFTPEGRRVIVRANEVLIRDKSGNELPMEFKSNGFYELLIPDDHPTFKVDYYKSYQIEIIGVEGRTIQSGFEPLVPNADFATLSGEAISKTIQDYKGVILDAPFIEYHIDVSNAMNEWGMRPRYIWFLDPTYQITEFETFNLARPPRTCWLSELHSVNEPILFDGNTLEKDRIPNFHLYDDRIDYSYAEGLYFNVYQESLSAGAFRYWSEIRESVVRTGDMFESAAGKLHANWHNVADTEEEIFGYFYATNVDTVRLYIGPEQAGNPQIYCIRELFPGPGHPPLVCRDCKSAYRSQTTKPHYWEE